MSDESPVETEEALVAKIREGDAEAFVEYTETKRPPLLAFAERKMSDGLKRKVEPMDIVQEVIIGAAESFSEIDFSQREPFGWLCHLAERRIIDSHRRFFGAKKRAADKEVAIDKPAGDSGSGAMAQLLVASMTSPSSAFSRGQREFKMLEAVDDLAEDARQALRMRYVEGLPSKEIAERIGKSDAAVRVLLTRSLARLQKTLGQDTWFKSYVQQPPTED